MKGRRALAALLVALALPALAAPAALAACPRTSLPDIEDEVMCPVCGTPLAVAEQAPQAQRERAFIRAAIARCESKQQIKDRLVAQFGPRILAVPAKQGFSLTAWLVPILALLVATLVLAFTVPRWRRRRGGGPPQPPGPAPSEAERSRLERELELADP